MSVHQYLLLSALLNIKKKTINMPLSMYDNYFNRHQLPIIKTKEVGSDVIVTVDRELACSLIKNRNNFIKEGSSLGN